MRWIAKAFLQKLIGALPWRDELNLFFQRHVTQSLPVSRELFITRAENAFWHLDALRRHVQGPAAMPVLEFGAGWDLEIPLILAAAGVRQQTVIDRRRLMRYQLVSHSLRLLQETAAELSQQHGCALQPGDNDCEPRRALADRGIEYLVAQIERAPFCDASFSFVHSTWTVNYIAERRLPEVFAECRRLLAPGGVLSCVIETYDNFSNFDRRIGPYNYLRYSKQAWPWFESNLLAQNRLRADDYYKLLAEAGFELLESRESKPPEETWRRELGRMALAEPFRGQPLDRLAVTEVHAVFRKRD